MRGERWGWARGGERARRGEGRPPPPSCPLLLPPLLSSFSHLVLATHVPGGEGEFLVFHLLHVEAWRRGRRRRGERGGRGRERDESGALGQTDSENRRAFLFLVPARPPRPCRPPPHQSWGWSSRSRPDSACSGWWSYPRRRARPGEGKERGWGREREREHKKRSTRGGRAREGRPATRPSPFIRPAQPPGMTCTSPTGREARDEVGGAQGCEARGGAARSRSSLPRARPPTPPALSLCRSPSRSAYPSWSSAAKKTWAAWRSRSPRKFLLGLSFAISPLSYPKKRLKPHKNFRRPNMCSEHVQRSTRLDWGRRADVVSVLLKAKGAPHPLSPAPPAPHPPAK